jgi:SH3 domain protein
MPDIEKKMVDTNRRKQDLTLKLRENAQELHNLKREYEALKLGASSYLELKETHISTQSALEKNQKDVQRLTKENESLRSSQMNKWFAIGAVVVLCGLMLGLVVGRQQRKRKSLYY